MTAAGGTAIARTIAPDWTVCIISVRDPLTDFRRDLAVALRQLGARVIYLRLGRICFVDDGSGTEGTWRSPLFVLRQLFSLNTKSCVLLTVNTGFPAFSILMRLASWRTVWFFDEHDDLLYGSRGLKRCVETLKLALFRRLASRSVCVSPKLCERVPASLLIPNASAVRRTRRGPLDLSRIVILSNIDERFDFAFVRDLMAHAPFVEVHVFGGKAEDREIMRQFDELRRSPRLIDHGPYKGAGIQQILDRFDVMLVPYLIDESTYYIDPLRFYHALNNGLEIVASKIPRANDMEERLHLVDDGAGAARVLAGLDDGTFAPKNQGDLPCMTWEDRAVSLLRGAEAARGG